MSEGCSQLLRRRVELIISDLENYQVKSLLMPSEQCSHQKNDHQIYTTLGLIVPVVRCQIFQKF